ncbi:MAG: PAS domain S-box protein [Planctomycetota bacterium]|nr:PAS domain S-box protein [Planctomycetota bacterium]
MSTLTDQPAPADPAAAATALPTANSGPHLRQRAEAAFREQAAQLPEDRAPLSPEATQRLLYELQVHQIELEMQNEELRQSQTALADANARYLTARKQTEASLHLSEEKFAKAFRSCPDAFILSSAPDSRITEINDAVTRISGYAPEELLGRTTVELGLWADPGERDRYVALVCREGRVVDFEAVFRTKSGTRRTCLMSTEIIQLATGPHFLSVLRDITEHQQAEAQTRRWQQVFTTAGFSLVHTDVATNTFLEVNDFCARQRGYTPAELVGQPITTIYPPETLPAMRERLNAIDEVGHLAFETVHRRKDGSTFPVLVDVTTIRDAAGQPVSRVAYALDITEHRQAEAKLRESEARYRLLAENGSDVIWLLDLRTQRFTYTSPAVMKLRGFTPEEVSQHTLADTLTPESCQKVATLLPPRLAAFAVGDDSVRSQTYELDMFRRDGSVVPVEVATTLIADDHRLVTHIQGITRDLTERRQAEDALQLFKAIVESAEEAVAISDLAGELSYINPAHEKLFGYSLAEARRLNFRDLYPPESLAVLNQVVAPKLARGESWEGELETFDRTGRRFPLWERAGTVRDAAGKVLYAFGFMHDITERRQAEERFEMLRKLGFALASSSDLPATLRLCLETAIQVGGMDAGGIYLAEEPSGDLKLVCHAGLSADFVAAVSHFPADSANARWAREGKILYGQARTQGRPAPTIEEQEGLRALSLFPVHYVGRLLAVLNVTSHTVDEMPPAARMALETVTGLLGGLLHRLHAKEELQASAGQMRALLASLDDLVFVLDRNFVFQEYHQPPTAKLLVAPEFFVGQRFEEIGFPEPALGIVKGALTRTLETSTTTQAEYWLDMPQGQAWFDIHVTAFRVEDGPPTGLTCVVRNITAARQAKTALQESERLQRLALQIGHIGTMEVDLTNPRVRWSPEWAAIWGLPENFTGDFQTFYWARIHPDDLGWVQAQYAHQMESLEEHEMLFRILRPDGELRWISSRGQVLPETAGEGKRIIGVVLDVTEQKQAEQALRAREAQLKLALDAGRAITWEWDIASDTISYSSNAADFSRGKDQTPFSSRTSLAEQIHPDDRALVAEAFRRTKEESVPIDCEHRARLLDGACHWVLAKGNVTTTDRTGQAVRVAGVVVDITERKLLAEELSQLNRQLEQRVAERTAELSREIARRRQTEASLQASEQRHRDLVETIPGWVWEVDERGVYTFASAQCGDLLGYTPEEILGRSPFDFMPPEEAERVASLILPVMTCGEPICGLENTCRHKDGRLVIVETNGVPIRDATGKLRGYCGLDHDITKRRQAETQLRKLQSAVEQSPTAVVITDTTGAIEYVNPQFTVQTGYTAAEALGQNLRFLQSGQHPREFFVQMWETLRAGHIWRGELCNQRKDGTPFWESAAIAPIRDHAGWLTHYVAIKEDITERRRVAEELRQAKEAADAANLAKSRFLANMSHEIRTPMNAILGFSQLLLRDAERSGRGHPEYVTTILRSGEHLLRIINDILEMARIESGRVTLNLAPFDLYRLLEDLERMFRLRAQTKQLRFHVERQGEVPQHLLADETKLRQVLINLLGNAVKFTPNGGAITLRVRSEPEPDGALRLHAEIEDTGLGIAPEDLPHLFEPFFQTSSGRQVTGGTGLGLPISQEFVRLMGGKLEVASQVGVGSTFRFDVRVSRAQATAAGAERTAGPGSVRLLPGQPACRVLIVDDLPENRDLLVQLLAPVGFEVRTAVDGVEAVAHCQEWAPQLVLMDLRMPGMDGYEATRRIRTAHGALVKIIALSASAFTESKQRAFAEGADAFISKPLQTADLLDRIKDLVGVDYVDVAPQEAAATVHDEAVAERLTAGEMCRLPAELVAALREATCRADYQQMLNLVEQAATHDKRLGRLLRQLVKRFDYATLHELLAADPPNV